MPRGPKGQKRPADVIGNAIRVAKIATGDGGMNKLPLAKVRYARVMIDHQGHCGIVTVKAAATD